MVLRQQHLLTSTCCSPLSPQCLASGAFESNPSHGVRHPPRERQRREPEAGHADPEQVWASGRDCARKMELWRLMPLSRGLEPPFDIILMIVSMPYMGNMEATELIRVYEAHGGLLRRPIIALTAHATISDRERYLQAGRQGRPYHQTTTPRRPPQRDQQARL
ncbi:hypothetical protein M422DRAFT_50142 [Sphaerobolus stellatus SS14]|uniref:Unplaced genomic scaffold SPHSTscaffold_88, whole genome shotgun sequence n=1 Tax=Sphaerobolus stellatus (strain SS14) TaxID=990650 RepID=A0A0C9UTA5_SPHS4|nr:hypothetical protein M422DRAFT_50142 [Sphaerobolus stellatus SS14]